MRNKTTGNWKRVGLAIAIGTLVHAGGQAIVGNVGAPARSAATASPPIAPLALPDRSDEAMPLIEEREKQKVPRKLRSR